MSDKIEKWIDEALRAAPSVNMRSDFTDRVVKAIRKQERRSSRRLYLLMVLGVLVMFGLGFGTISYFMPSVLSSFGKVGDVVPYAIILGLILALIQYLDKKLVRDKLMIN